MHGARILVVDDSWSFRELMRRTLVGLPGIAAVKTAAGGREAIAMLDEFAPDLVTLDVMMPSMDGIETLGALRRRSPTLPVIMISALTGPGADAAIAALSHGASDCIEKPWQDDHREASVVLREMLLPRFGALIRPRDGTGSAISGDDLPPAAAPRRGVYPPRPVSFVAIGISTGGPEALATLLAALPGTLSVPVLIVQHMPRAFTGRLAKRLDALTALRVREASDGDALAAGTVLIAPGERHMIVVPGRDGEAFVALNDDPPENSCRPSVDVLFRSLAGFADAGTLAVMMTGMGRDGLEGCRALAAVGARILAQDEASSVVWSMPGTVARAGLADAIVPLDGLAEAIAMHLPSSPRRSRRPPLDRQASARGTRR